MNGLLSPGLRRWRFRRVAAYVSGRVLDYGCGEGLLPGYMDVAAYTGVDASEAALAAARRNHPEGRFMPPDALAPDSRYDTIVCLAAVEYIADLDTLLRCFASHLAPGGRVVVTSPTRSTDLVRRVGVALGMLGNQGHEARLHLPSKTELKGIAMRNGLQMDRHAYFMLGMNQLWVFTARDDG